MISEETELIKGTNDQPWDRTDKGYKWSARRQNW